MNENDAFPIMSIFELEDWLVNEIQLDKVWIKWFWEPAQHNLIYIR